MIRTPAGRTILPKSLRLVPRDGRIALSGLNEVCRTHRYSLASQTASAAFVIRILAVPAFDDNYLWLVCDDAGNAVAIDPGDAAPVLAALHANGLMLRAILLTHHHADHIGGVAALCERYPVDVFAPDDERITCATRRVSGGDHIDLATPSLRLQVLALPGHTRTHIGYYGAGLLFCGDTLFSAGCGRLFEGTPAQMLASLDSLAALPADTAVYCAHEYTWSNCAYAATVEPGNPALQDRIRQVRELRASGLPSLPSSIGLERATNPFLRVDLPALIDWGLHSHGIAPAARVERFAALRRGKDQFRSPTP
jgi:hydroxyacylglutathione hydrolase